MDGNRKVSKQKNNESSHLEDENYEGQGTGETNVLTEDEEVVKGTRDSGGSSDDQYMIDTQLQEGENGEIREANEETQTQGRKIESAQHKLSESTHEDEIQEDEYENLINKLLFSAGDEYIFTSWEPGRTNQYYFPTTKEYGQQAEAWLEDTMNYFLIRYEIEACQERFATGFPEMPRSEPKT